MSLPAPSEPIAPGLQTLPAPGPGAGSFFVGDRHVRALSRLRGVGDAAVLAAPCLVFVFVLVLIRAAACVTRVVASFIPDVPVEARAPDLDINQT
jgi:hypothetical protein